MPLVAIRVDDLIWVRLLPVAPEKDAVLRDSIRQWGILVPPLVMTVEGEPNKYAIVLGKGARRAEVAQQLGLTNINCQVLPHEVVIRLRP